MTASIFSLSRYKNIFSVTSISILLISSLLLPAEVLAETDSEAARRSGAIVSSVEGFARAEAGEAREVRWDIISYLDIASKIKVTFPSGRSEIFNANRTSRNEASYRIGSASSYTHSFVGTIEVPADEESGQATVGFYAYDQSVDRPSGMFALLPAGLIQRPVGLQAKQFEWDIDAMGSSASSFPLPENVNRFVSNIAGTCNDQDGSYGCQCVDLMHLYIDTVLGVPRAAHNIRGNAYPIYQGFASSKTISSGTRSVRLDKISNSPSAIPRKGDIIFFSNSNGIGHVGIFIEGDVNRFTSFDQNWNNANVNSGSPAAVIEHKYTGNYPVAGWLRPTLVAD